MKILIKLLVAAQRIDIYKFPIVNDFNRCSTKYNLDMDEDYIQLQLHMLFGTSCISNVEKSKLLRNNIIKDYNPIDAAAKEDIQKLCNMCFGVLKRSSKKRNL